MEDNQNEQSITRQFITKGTTCRNCEETVKKQAMKVRGVREVHFSANTERGSVVFDPKITDIDEILSKIEEKGHKCYILEGKGPATINIKTVVAILGMAGIAIAAFFLYKLFWGVELPEISQNIGYGLLFLVGLLTGFHCIAMCGGFVVSYTAKDAQEGRKSQKSHLLYGFGKLVSYTAIGAAFGLIGSIIAFTPLMRGVAGLLSGLFLVLFGITMLGVFPSLRRFQLRTPKFLNRIVGKNQSTNPLVIGLFNGLMIACGPLQAIYIMAAGTGSVVEGAKMLFIFGLGTLPVMLGFGYLTSFVSSKMTHKILKLSGVVVIILGLIMINRGFALTGSGYDIKSLAGSREINLQEPSGSKLSSGTASSNVALLSDGYQEIRMTVDAGGYTPDVFILKKGVPVKWIIDGKQITNCNKAIQVPKLGLSFDIKQGEQTIEFTPTESGTISWSCWMGMIPGTFIVKDSIDLNDKTAVQAELANTATPKAAGGACGMAAGTGGGGCGCGMK
jgi:sulfite exporter TauE/SafE/copper chaperone CopZ